MDMWALGCILYQLVTTRLLIDDLDPMRKGTQQDFRPADDRQLLPLLAALCDDGGQERIDALVDKYYEPRRHVALAYDATSLLKMLLRADPNQRVAITEVVNHAFIKGGSMVTMTVDTVRDMSQTMQEMNGKLDTVVSTVIRIDDRTVGLAELMGHVSEQLLNVNKQLSGLRTLVVDVSIKKCPTRFVVVPELPPK